MKTKVIIHQSIIIIIIIILKSDNIEKNIKPWYSGTAAWLAHLFHWLKSEDSDFKYYSC